VANTNSAAKAGCKFRYRMRCRKGLKPLKGRVSLETTRANPRKRSESEAIRGRMVRGTPKPGIVIKIGVV